jgi:hypothetical protein
MESTETRKMKHAKRLKSSLECGLLDPRECLHEIEIWRSAMLRIPNDCEVAQKRYFLHNGKDKWKATSLEIAVTKANLWFMCSKWLPNPLFYNRGQELLPDLLM